jgi:hypothetical protein
MRSTISSVWSWVARTASAICGLSLSRTQPWNARVKDQLENFLHAEVCAGRIPIEQAQREIAQDWIAAYQKYLGEPPTAPARRRGKRLS